MVRVLCYGHKSYKFDSYTRLNKSFLLLITIDGVAQRLALSFKTFYNNYDFYKYSALRARKNKYSAHTHFVSYVIAKKKYIIRGYVVEGSTF